jgi:hypothetical protein
MINVVSLQLQAYSKLRAVVYNARKTNALIGKNPNKLPKHIISKFKTILTSLSKQHLPKKDTFLTEPDIEILFKTSLIDDFNDRLYGKASAWVGPNKEFKGQIVLANRYISKINSLDIYLKTLSESFSHEFMHLCQAYLLGAGTVSLREPGMFLISHFNYVEDSVLKKELFSILQLNTSNMSDIYKERDLVDTQNEIAYYGNTDEISAHAKDLISELWRIKHLRNIYKLFYSPYLDTTLFNNVLKMSSTYVTYKKLPRDIKNRLLKEAYLNLLLFRQELLVLVTN